MIRSSRKLSDIFKKSLWQSSNISLFVVFITVILVATWRFYPWMSPVFYGDDLWYLLSYYD
jgi:hypothetical protein